MISKLLALALPICLLLLVARRRRRGGGEWYPEPCETGIEDPRLMWRA